MKLMAPAVSHQAETDACAYTHTITACQSPSTQHSGWQNNFYSFLAVMVVIKVNIITTSCSYMYSRLLLGPPVLCYHEHI